MSRNSTSEHVTFTTKSLERPSFLISAHCVNTPPLQVSLKGARNCIEAAMARIEEIVKDLQEQVSLDCEIEQQYHR